VDFRLDLLKEIASFNLRDSYTAYADDEIRQRVTMLPIDLVPLTRAAVGLESTDEAKEIVAARGYRDRSKDDTADELLRAAITTLEARVATEYRRPVLSPNYRSERAVSSGDAFRIVCPRGDLNTDNPRIGQ
jgi:hypothetical protein